MSTFGPAFNESLDGPRIRKAIDRIRDYMLASGWHTLHEIAQATACPEASVSANLRHLRKRQFGEFVVLKVRGESTGLWYYRVTQPAPKQAVQLEFKEESNGRN